MTDELPPLWALDKAAKAATFDGWEAFSHVSAVNSPFRASIIAHARTIAQWEQPPVDEDEERFRDLLETLGLRPDDCTPSQYAAALAQFKRELEARK